MTFKEALIRVQTLMDTIKVPMEDAAQAAEARILLRACIRTLDAIEKGVEVNDDETDD